jgi:phosphate:Na+ symporter
MTEQAYKNIKASFNAFIEGQLSKRGDIERREDTIDRLQTDVTAFLTDLSRLDLSKNVSRSIPRLIHCVNDAERIGDQAENLIELTELKLAHKLKLKEAPQADLKNYFELIEQQFQAVIRAISKRDKAAICEALKLEKQINKAHEKLSQNNINRLEGNDVNVIGGIVFFDVIAKLERIGDHLTNIAERIQIDGVQCKIF